MNVAPDLKTFLELARRHPQRLIPVTRRFLADTLTPVEAFRRLGQDKHGFLLESVEHGERVGRYSFVGSAPEVVIRGDVLPEPYFREDFAGRPPGARQSGSVLDALERRLTHERAIQPDPALGVPPFAGGAVGYLGYDTVRFVEPRLFRKPPARRGTPDIPDVFVAIYRTIIAFDHVKNVIFVVHHADPRSGAAEAAYCQAQTQLSQVVARLVAPGTTPLTELAAPSGGTEAVASNFARADFLAAVRRAKDYIAAGDVIQVVLSQRFSRDTRARPFEVYRCLRAVNPSPYMFYLRAPEVHLVGSSPEVMVRAQDGCITVRPIAGTRPRGATPEEDARLAAELLADPKERAEHVMLVDLGRNDVGRVARLDSVKLTERMVIEYYSHVMHIVSNVTGQVREGLGAFDVLRACHPAGTVSGAPKIRAMEIIDELEPDSRGPYAGAVGVLDFHGNLNTAIVLRTIFMQPHPDGGFRAHIQAGAGLVADSVPEREYEETQNKARALFRALEAAEAQAEPD